MLKKNSLINVLDDEKLLNVIKGRFRQPLEPWHFANLCEDLDSAPNMVEKGLGKIPIIKGAVSFIVDHNRVDAFPQAPKGSQLFQKDLAQARLAAVQ